MNVCSQTTILFILFSCYVVSNSSNRNQVVLKDNIYQNLLIAINKNVSDNQEIIDKIKDAFTNGSKRLFEATNRRAYWQTITILVPKSWSPRSEYEVVKTESFARANIVIDLPNERWDDNPYTLQLGGCGRKGEYIHLTPNYLLNKERSESIWGPTDKMLVHEWGHLQWGLFDEYSTETSTNFHAHSNENIEATRCSLAVKGRYINAYTLKECHVDPSTGVYQKECVFLPDTKGQTATGSIMYGQFIDSVNAFCHSDPNDPLGYHDVEMPHKHNTLCGSQSAWDVMLKSEDFRHDVNLPVAGNVDTTPTFRIVQPTDRRVVLVLDTSGSMAGDKLHQLRQSATHYLMYTIDSGSFVGIVEFSYSYATKVLSELVYIDDDLSRESLVAVLPTVASGGTSIESGVLKGIEVLSRGTQKAAGGYLLLMSDGINNDPNGISSILDDVVDEGVIVDTIAFTKESDLGLKNISDASGGISFFFNGVDDISVLNSAFETTVTSRPDQSSQELPITIYSDAVKVQLVNIDVGDTVVIDSSVGIDTVFSFSWIKSSSIQVTLTYPDGNNVDTSLFKIDNALKVINIKIPGTAMVGSWVFQIQSSTADVITVNVQSKPSEEDPIPITVTALVGDPSIDYTTYPITVIYAIVRKGYLPVINARVLAIVEGSTSIVEMELLDNGAGSDITKDDGIYSGYFHDASENGRYSIKIKVKSPDQTTAVFNMARATGSLPIIPDTTNNELPVFTPTGMFSRIASGGVIEVSGYVNQPNDVLAPSQILDLSVLETLYAEQKVVLKWTAVGDDLDSGNATRYELRVANSFYHLLSNFTNAREVTNTDVIEGDITSVSPAGVIEKIALQVSTDGQNVTYFFAVRAHDESGNYGSVSNIVSANMRFIPPIPASVNSTDSPVNSTDIYTEIITAQTDHTTTNVPSTDPPQQLETTERPDEQENCRKALWVSLGVVAVIAFLSIVIGLIVCLKKKNKVGDNPETIIEMETQSTFHI